MEASPLVMYESMASQRRRCIHTHRAGNGASTHIAQGTMHLHTLRVRRCIHTLCAEEGDPHTLCIGICIFTRCAGDDASTHNAHEVVHTHTLCSRLWFSSTDCAADTAFTFVAQEIMHSQMFRRRCIHISCADDASTKL
eukprot:jgi/Botrbrau1/12286/Bobra.27_5s0002.1